MMARGRLALPALAVVLLLLLLAEWVSPGAAPTEPLSLPAVRTAAADPSANSDFAAWTGTILARPLLSPSRRPAAQADATVSDILPRLSAIIVMGGIRHAIFAATGEKPQLVAEGGEIGLYRIKTVAPDRVDLLGPNGPVTLKPQFIGIAMAAPAPAQ